MRPHIQFGLALAASAALITTAIAAPVSHGGRKFTVVLTGAAERPGPGDSDATGTAKVYVNVGQRRVCWSFENLSNLDTLSGAHIHRAPATAPGPVVVGFFGTAATADIEHCTESPLSRALLTEIIQHPERFYVNLHTTVYPAGAIRGQMSK